MAAGPLKEVLDVAFGSLAGSPLELVGAQAGEQPGSDLVQGAALRGRRRRAEEVALSGCRTGEDGRLRVLTAGEERLGEALQAGGDPAAVSQAQAQLEGAAERLPGGVWVTAVQQQSAGRLQR